MPSYRRTTMCSECPFRAIAAPGWLGPWTPEEVEAMVRGDQNFICHPEITALKSKGLSEIRVEAKGQHCVGFLRYMSSLCQRSRDPEKAEFQDKLKKIKDVPLIPARTFVEHHRRGIVAAEMDL